MIATIKILWNSLKMAVLELRVNKLRTFLSLLGITIGIFCIIAVLTATNSLERNVRNEVETLGSDVVYIQKWPWDGGPDFPWWKYVNRPLPKFQELTPIKDKVQSAGLSAFAFSASGKRVEYKDGYMEGTELFAVSGDYEKIQALTFLSGRFFAGKENENGANVAILGANIWEGLFGTSDKAMEKTIAVAGRPVRVIGTLKKKGASLVDGINYDNSVIVPYVFGRTIVDERRFADPFILVKAAPGATLLQLKDELRGVMRSIRRLRPKEEDDFSLNEITAVSGDLNKVFGMVNMGGWLIACFALIVGGFGIANIMFVTVKERTNIIGLKKAIGARKKVILMEFLLESMILCMLGGLLGLVLVFLTTVAVNSLHFFEFTLTLNNIILGLTVSSVVGIIAGFIPAYLASKLDPVVAIRSN
ncbi:putative ABC transport system permease protein [Chitinophaga sp. YR627]|uniref:ABC transporter permease n=1 Tax=Chitinophaga sp. YR627 TaxID=1881041 RepID=UPI0008F17DF5|nr:ABC transporter permease [Chitinophaga sp. YR627]SFO72722.1 putative ABC transport system permease protein [Chitinophaga sp. YR627]